MRFCVEADNADHAGAGSHGLWPGRARIENYFRIITDNRGKGGS
jgi:hypothetical protein